MLEEIHKSPAEVYREQANKGQRAALALEYVGELIDEEIKGIYTALASPERKDVEILVTYLRAATWLKNVLTNHKAIGEESAKKLQQEE